MTLSHVFIDRPIFATVLSTVIVVAGAVGYFTLPVAQYPEVVPPTVVVTAYCPGATWEVIADAVATPIERKVNGVENMLYMASQSMSDSEMRLTITFRLGTELNEAQVPVQNRVAIAEVRLPEDVRRIGVTTRTSSPDFGGAPRLHHSLDRPPPAPIVGHKVESMLKIASRLSPGQTAGGLA
jgi:multidrug efflux pump subunit AcrB